MSQTPPNGARFEAQPAGGVAIWDVAHLLPAHAQKRYRSRDPATVELLIVHHSGADGQDGYDGMAASARYAVQHHDWPGFSYTWWISAEPDIDDAGRIVVYRGNPDHVVSYHTGALNSRGVAICLQGHLGSHPMSDEQIEALEAMLPWVERRYEGIHYPAGFTWHAEAAKHGGRDKPSCPGAYPIRWLEAYRALT